jgi:GNAT superfamily N-acetyltransferase
MQLQELTALKIRPFEADDYDAIARLHSVNFPEFGMHADEWRFEDEHRAPHCRLARWVAELDEHVVAFVQYDQHASHFHPRKFEFNLMVDPGYFLRGIGRRLFDFMLAEVRREQPLSLDAWSRENMAYRVGFLERRGFVEDWRMWTSALDLTTFDPRRFAHVPLAVEAQGIQIRSLAEVGPTDPVVRRRLYDMWCEIRLDVPHPPSDEYADVSFERYQENIDRPYFLAEGYMVAIDGDKYVGTSQLAGSPDEGVLRTGLTGVRRAYRRRGIAFAMKVRSLEIGQKLGYSRAITENEVRNRGMLAINDELGFVKSPAWVHYTKGFEA